MLSLVTRVMIFAIAAMSLDLILGFGAMVSFGHAAFLGIGAYAVGILPATASTTRFCSSPWRSPPRPCSRSSPARSRCARKGVYFIMITLAFGQMLYLPRHLARAPMAATTA